MSNRLKLPIEYSSYVSVHSIVIDTLLHAFFKNATFIPYFQFQLTDISYRAQRTSVMNVTLVHWFTWLWLLDCPLCCFVQKCNYFIKKYSNCHLLWCRSFVGLENGPLPSWLWFLNEMGGRILYDLSSFTYCVCWTNVVLSVMKSIQSISRKRQKTFWSKVAKDAVLTGGIVILLQDGIGGDDWYRHEIKWCKRRALVTIMYSEFDVLLVRKQRLRTDVQWEWSAALPWKKCFRKTSSFTVKRRHAERHPNHPW